VWELVSVWHKGYALQVSSLKKQRPSGAGKVGWGRANPSGRNGKVGALKAGEDVSLPDAATENANSNSDD